jgi:tRNA G18 (ribose-2'-O)-methylase SpoU
MLHVQRIESFNDHPLLAPYGTMQRVLEHREQGIFVAEGYQVLERLLESDLKIQSVLLPEKWLEHFRKALEQRGAPDLRVFLAEKELMETLTGYQFYQGVLAVAHAPKAPTVEQLFSIAPGPGLFLAFDGVAQADNIGQLVRTAAAFRVHGIVTSHTSCSVYMRRAVRTSMGAIFSIPVAEQVDLPEALSFFKAQGTKIIAAHPGSKQGLLHEADFRNDCLIILGSEGQGISEAALALSDVSVAIPMPAAVDSLNVNAAGAVFLYEVQRQRGFE